ncbi:class I SAM-dependent DNA methyltransferase [Jeotgalibaca ciconiae]|uniref:Class I SAM-dependent methyltransferase n=1 Tax=Jeotgalibaca ciconiae TaxID=2496265 RepID=A0A3Q9BLE3_9LACT|nr:class I SAM-dependent methyltransferase [Jeotgalibaca ciconiae]AZP05077.1 class I SAM-dependent methyltransferase [Jeotgalibaca ciconiae]HJB23966.1 class I SAM-dependent methyltransferase [Candidatus Jeotgalibaca pullicola]
MSYQIFSNFYDKVMDQSVYDDWLSFVRQYQAKYHGERQSLEILELACGTGIIATKLAEKGHTVTGFDLSDDMLSLAYDRMGQKDVTIQLMQGDMRDLPFIQNFDMVTCFSDSLCYLHEEEELLQVFQGVHANLCMGGTFLFDVHSLYQMNEIFPGYQYIYQEEEEVFLWESFLGEQENSVEHVLTFFVEEADGRYERMQEVHEERSFSIDVYQRLLKKAGFTSVEVKADFGKEEVTETTTRWFFVARK